MAHAQIVKLVNDLNKYRDAYYNDNTSLISDKEYDDLFDELQSLEEATGLILSNSPTQTVGYEVKSYLTKVTHCYPPMLSLDKTKEISKIKEFLDGKYGVIMAKLDGLTCRLTYYNGKLIRAETRGNGIEGEDITHNAYVISGIPLSIPNVSGEFIIDGEIIVTRNKFTKLKAKFLDEKGKQYKNARNYASGSARLKSNKECAERELQFIAWKFVKGYHFKHFGSNLNELSEFGFTEVPFTEIKAASNENILEASVKYIQDICEHYSYPIDGCVFSFDEMSYLDTFTYTSHHWKAQMAFKFYDDKYDTTIRSIRWTIGKTGALTPTAIFDPVEIDGTEVCKASVHNLTIMKKLNIRENCTAKVFKANMIIPQVESCEDDGENDFIIPTFCPYCEYPTKVIKENDSEELMCTNPFCKGILLSKLSTFVSKQGMNIDGLSKGILNTLIEQEYIENFTDIYRLYKYESALKLIPGFGDTSVNKLIQAIENSRIVSLPNFLTALSINNIGYASAKVISDVCEGSIENFYQKILNKYDFSNIENFGETTNQDIHNWFENKYNKEQFEELLLNYITVNTPQTVSMEIIYDSPIAGKTFCITGTFSQPRSELQKKLEQLGGTAMSGVSKKTDILFCGENAGSKLSKAKSLGITIVTDIDKWLGGDN